VGLAIVGILASVIGCYYYLNIIVAMYFRSDAAKGHGGDAEQSSASQPFLIGVGPGAVLTFCAIAVVLLGTFPSLIYDLGANTNVPQMASQITLIPIE
jgi:NADH:ubiquinone oxidoreductase subunit 2 (subunit N)